MIDAETAPRTILAPNPSPLTGRGTNSFLLGRREIAVIDPGPLVASHLQAIMAAAGKGRITHILVTHAHLDHSQGARALAEATGAVILGHGAPTAGRSPAMQALAADGQMGGGEGLDHDFHPDLCLKDGEEITTDEWRLQARHTPGHFGGHLSFVSGSRIFCGDIVMGWSSTLISPPDGDLGDYMRSLSLLARLAPRQLLPAHGDPICDPQRRLAELTAHRKARTAQILQALDRGPATAGDLARQIYDIAPALLPAAARNTLAHLIALHELGAVATALPLAHDSMFYRA